MGESGRRDDHWDVVVVGAGPAGSSAAASAAASGARVLLLDKAQFPRYKTCGGGLIGPSLALLPSPVHTAIHTWASTATFSSMPDQSVTRTEPTPFVAMSSREQLDLALVEFAVSMGAEFRDSTRVEGIDQTANEVQVALRGGFLTASIVIGADGCGGRVGRAIGFHPTRLDLGLEAEVPIPNPRSQWKDTVRIDWGKSPGTYAWVFPKDDHLTVGVIQRKGFPEQTHAYLKAWMEFLDLAREEPVRQSGHLTQWGDPRSVVRAGRIMLAGESAGLLEPWTREGISFALRSGKLAGEYASKALGGDSTNTSGVLEQYDRRLKDELWPEIEAGAKLLQIFEKHPFLISFGMSHFSFASDYFVQYCKGDRRFAELPQIPLSLAHFILS